MKQLTALLLTVFLGSVTQAAEPWVERSDDNARLVLDLLARFSPEGAAALGVDGLDEEIFDLRPKLHERTDKAGRDVLKKLTKKRDQENDPLVRQDLEILIQAVENSLRTSQLQHDTLLPYYNVSQNIFQGIRALIDPQVAAERYPAAVVRLRKYAGLERGHKPITELARDRTEERFGVAGLIGPYRGEVEQDLQRAETFVAGIKDILANSGVENWQAPYEALAKELRAYEDWLRAEILPRARDDFKLPPALYEDALRNWGVYASPEELIAMATHGYMEIRNEMIALAPLVAKEKDYEHTGYREVIARLKEERIPGNELLEYYYARLKDIEDFLRENDIVTLPERDAGIRIATEAETAAQPSAHLDIPRLIGNTGEYPEFVLPQLKKDEQGNWIGTDDTYEAGTWTLTAHEARPGHELQFSSMLETGVSVARAIFAFNSANVEGWGLYAEAIAKPYMPLEGQLISLQYRLTRAARMFLDPMLNLGLIDAAEAKRLLVEDVLLGESWAQNEIERYTYRIPGQATAYYYGYMKMQSLRIRTELALEDRFRARAFHDFVLAQGLLPPDLLEKAVMERFVPQQLERVATTH